LYRIGGTPAFTSFLGTDQVIGGVPHLHPTTENFLGATADSSGGTAAPRPAAYAVGNRANSRATDVACQWPVPLIVGIERALSSIAMALRLRNPAARSSAMMGCKSAARR
jgi:hypothetical protein